MVILQYIILLNKKVRLKFKYFRIIIFKKFNMKKTSYILSSCLLILTFIIASCDKEEDQEQLVNCLAVGTWSLSYLSIEYDNNINTIVLLFENNMHFKIVGYFNGNNMQTLFDQKSMPIEILKLINYLR